MRAVQEMGNSVVGEAFGRLEFGVQVRIVHGTAELMEKMMEADQALDQALDQT